MGGVICWLYFLRFLSRILQNAKAKNELDEEQNVQEEFKAS